MFGHADDMEEDVFEAPKLDVVGHCVSCGNPIYGQARVIETQTPIVKRTCYCTPTPTYVRDYPAMPVQPTYPTLIPWTNPNSYPYGGIGTGTGTQITCGSEVTNFDYSTYIPNITSVGGTDGTVSMYYNFNLAANANCANGVATTMIPLDICTTGYMDTI